MKKKVKKNKQKQNLLTKNMFCLKGEKWIEVTSTGRVPGS